MLLLRCVRRGGVLEETGYIVRRPDPDDRRSSAVALTDTPWTVDDEAVVDHIANANRLLAALTANERASLDRAPRKLLTQIESPAAHRSGRSRCRGKRGCP